MPWVDAMGLFEEVDELQIPIPIDIQSYHVRFGVWVVNFEVRICSQQVFGCLGNDAIV